VEMVTEGTHLNVPLMLQNGPFQLWIRQVSNEHEICIGKSVIKQLKL
jgi:hypothetical protein